MSYSFSVCAKTKDELRAAAAAKFDDTVAGQPVHAADKAAALANLDGALSVLPDAAEGCDLVATLGGYLQWRGVTSEPTEFTGVSISVNVSWARSPNPAA